MAFPNKVVMNSFGENQTSRSISYPILAQDAQSNRLKNSTLILILSIVLSGRITFVPLRCSIKM